MTTGCGTFGREKPSRIEFDSRGVKSDSPGARMHRTTERTIKKDSESATYFSFLIFYFAYSTACNSILLKFARTCVTSAACTSPALCISRLNRIGPGWSSGQKTVNLVIR